MIENNGQNLKKHQWRPQLQHTESMGVSHGHIFDVWDFLRR